MWNRRIPLILEPMLRPADRAEPVRVAVLGASGIGRYHVREFARAGAEITGILGSSPESAARTADKLARDYNEFGVKPKAFSDLDELLAQDLDAIAIATPHHLHQEATLRALLAGLHVFCEKPLFWHPGMTLADAHVALADLYMAGARERVCVNTSNASFVRALRERGLLPRRPREFTFRLRTTGTDEGADIGIDLLPHALSLLYEFAAPELSSPHTQCEKLFVHSSLNNFKACFRFKVAGDIARDVQCSFILSEYPENSKRMTFKVNELAFERIQRQDDSGMYRVFLKTADEEHEVEDPFCTYISSFLKAVRHGTSMPVSFDTSARILLDSMRLLKAANDSRRQRR